jgi:parvulin-like peptidyl-prolyl isomerase
VGLAALSLLGACGGGASYPSGTPSSSQSALALVDGIPLMQTDVDAIRAEARLAGSEVDETTAREQAIERLLVRREAERLGVTVAESDLKTRLAAIREAAGGEEALVKALDAAGMTAGQLSAATRAGLLRSALQDVMYADLKAGDGAVRAFYRKNRAALFTRPAELRLRQITLPGKALALRVAGEIERGMPFAAAARRYSMDPATRYEGGMVGWVSAPSLPAEVSKALARVPSGGVSAPVWSFARWHLYKILDRRAAVIAPFAQVSGQIRAELTRRMRADALDEWARRARQKATVEPAR